MLASHKLFRIKICGVTRLVDAQAAASAGADAIGLNFFEGSSRFIEKEQAVAVASAVRSAAKAAEEPPVKLVGVFVNATADYISDLAIACKLDAIQLHGDESAAFAWQVAERTGAPIIRAFALQNAGADAVVEFCSLPEAKEHLAAVLIDSAIPGQFGGTGVTADWEAVSYTHLTLPTKRIV